MFQPAPYNTLPSPMKTVTFEESESMDSLVKLVTRTRKTVVLTGAGISRNAGIPDFRSSTGLYKQSYENGTISCRELFDVSIYREVTTTRLFNRFMQKMYYETVRPARPTATHRFINKLKQHNKLLRCYTQNIDGLERQLGMRTEFDQLQDWAHLDVVQLHGDLNTLRCSRCRKRFSWPEIFIDQAGAEEDAGLIIACPECQKVYQERKDTGKRCCKGNIGIIRPNIVLYGEEHPYGEFLAGQLEKDISRKPKLFLIFGTSLRVVGVKKLVKEMCKSVHEGGGKVVIVNKDPVCQSQWGDLIDYQVLGDCDRWCDYVSSKFPIKRKRKLPEPTELEVIESPATKRVKLLWVN